MSTWEELQEEEENYKHDLEEWSGEYWSEAGFTEAGNILEDLISEVIAFIELLVGTPLKNNHQHHTKFEVSQDIDDQRLQAVHGCPTQTTNDCETKVGDVPTRSCCCAEQYHRIEVHSLRK